MAKAAWECISEEGSVATYRLEVAGGWLYRVTTGDAGGMALAFAPAAGGGKPDTAAASGQKTENMPRVDD